MSYSNLTWWFIHNRCLFIELLIQLSSLKPALQISRDIQWCEPTCLLHCKFDVVDETSTPQLLRYETHPWQNMSWMALKGLITVCGFLLVRKCCMRERRPQDTRVSRFCVHNMVWMTWILLQAKGRNELICVSVHYCSHMCLEQTQRVKGKHSRGVAYLWWEKLTAKDKAHPQPLMAGQEGMLGKFQSKECYSCRDRGEGNEFPHAYV